MAAVSPKSSRYGRTQVPGNPAHVFYDRVYVPRALFARLLQELMALRQVFFNESEMKLHRGEVLRQLVVKLTRKPLSFRLLGGENLCGEASELPFRFPQRVLCLLAFGNIGYHGEAALELPVAVEKRSCRHNRGYRLFVSFQGSRSRKFLSFRPPVRLSRDRKRLKPLSPKKSVTGRPISSSLEYPSVSENPLFT